MVLADAEGAGGSRNPRYIDASGEVLEAELEEAERAPAAANMTRRKSSPPCASGHTELFRATLLAVNGRRRWALTKLTCDNEAVCYRELMDEPALRAFVPELFAVAAVSEDVRAAHKPGTADVVVTIEDLTASCVAPCVMDIKMGSRTYLESEAGNGAPRHDLLRKLLEFAPREATADERANGVSKQRYMRIRDCYSTSFTHGYRLDGVHLCPHREPNDDAPSLPPNPRTLRRESQLDHVLSAYFDALPPPTGEALRIAFAERLRALRDALECSAWFSRHECIGSSLLFVYDGSSPQAAAATADIRWIDFTKVLDAEVSIDHRADWQPGTGSHEDGFLAGLDRLVAKLEQGPPDLGPLFADRATEPP
mmetsp:Transcript_8561/g.22114  ORF Transcript_8561/g.22114 Transcript_8561/m.22114 type:complete len:367 (-) Transcript_8561:406-1506(-)